MLRLSRYERKDIENRQFRSNAVTFIQNFRQKGSRAANHFQPRLRKQRGLAMTARTSCWYWDLCGWIKLSAFVRHFTLFCLAATLYVLLLGMRGVNKCPMITYRPRNTAMPAYDDIMCCHQLSTSSLKQQEYQEGQRHWQDIGLHAAGYNRAKSNFYGAAWHADAV